jgi:hypothetical protein
MKSIRIIPIILLFLLFGSNLYLGIITRPDPSFIKYLAFSAVYLIVGISLVSKIRFGDLLGVLIPLVIFLIYPLILDFKNLHPWSSGILAAMNAIVMISCFILVLLKLKTN